MSERKLSPGCRFYLKGEEKERTVKEIITGENGETWIGEQDGSRYREWDCYDEPPTLQITFETRDGCRDWQLVPYGKSQLKDRIFRAFRSSTLMSGSMVLPLSASEAPAVGREYRLIEPPRYWNGNRIFARYMEVE